MRHADRPPLWAPVRRFEWWWRRRLVKVSVHSLANPERWERLRLVLLAERGLTERECDDVRVP